MATPIGPTVLRAPLRLFNVSSTVLHNGDLVHVAFAYQDPDESVDSDDRVAVYCFDDADLEGSPDLVSNTSLKTTDDAYIDSQRTRYSVSDILTFGPLINMRCAWQFRFVTEDNDVLAISPLIHFVNGPEEPLQIHLTVTTNPSEIRVMWTSGGGGLMENGASTAPVIQYGASPTNLEFTAEATFTSYKASDLCGAPANTVAPRWFRDPGRIYSGVMENLKPNATYYYRVGAHANGEGNTSSSKLMSDIKQLFVPPAPGTNPQQTPGSSMSFHVFGDLAATVSATSDFMVPGSSGTTVRLIEHDIVESNISGHSYVAAFHIGDLSYARGAAFRWDQFGFLIEGVASRVPYLIGIGNHDYGYLEGRGRPNATHLFPEHPLFEADATNGFLAGGECGVPTTARFMMPANGNGAFWYSTELGLTHHAVLSSEHDFRAGSPMYTWLVNDLSHVDRTKTPWLFLHIHRPLYCSETYTSDYRRSLLLRNHLEHLLGVFRVDVVFSGHYHSYERTCPVYDEQCFYDETQAVAQAPVHIMVGSGGANVDSEGYYDRDWSLRVLQEYGYGRVHVYNATHVHFEFVANEYKGGGVKDSTWIISDHAWPNDRLRQNRTMPMSGWEIAGLVSVVSLALMVGLWFFSRRRAANLLYRNRAMKKTKSSEQPKAVNERSDEDDDDGSDVRDGLLLEVR